MNEYHIWFDLKDTRRDIEFSRSLSAYLGHLRNEGKIENYNLLRRKLGFGPPELGEFQIVIQARDLAQLDEAFNLAAARSGEVEKLHGAVYSAVKNVKFALYRDFPDPVRSTDA